MSSKFTSLPKLVRKILQATVYDVAIRTDLDKAPKLSQRFDNDIRFKREDTQPVFRLKSVVRITKSAN